jgi:DHA1 family tetracycline resistance protein-like MFS transporter
MRRPSLLPVFFTVFLDLLGFGLVLPLLPGFAQSYHASARVVGLLMGTYSLAQFFFAPVWGRLSDRIGRRPVLMLSITGSVLSYLIFAFAGETPAPLVVLFVSRALAGIMAANLSTAQAYVADVTAPEERAKAMGMVGAAFGLGFVVGPGIAAGIGGSGELGVGLVAAGLSFADLIYTAVALPESLPAEMRARARQQTEGRVARMTRALANPVLGLPIFTFFLATLVWSGLVEGTLSLYLNAEFRFGARDTGMTFLVLGLLVALVQGGLVRRLARGSAEPRMVLTGTLCVAVALFLAPFIPSAGWALAGVVAALVGLGQGMNTPALSSIISRQAPAEDQGSVLGVTQGFSSLARAVGPALGGWLFGLGMNLPFWAGAVLMSLAFLLAGRIASRLRVPA